MSMMDKRLEKAIRDGDHFSVKVMVEVDGVNWRLGNQEALYLAAKEDEKEIVSYFLKTLFEPPHRTEEDAKAFASTIDIAVSNMGTLSLLTLCLQGGARGLFRYLAETRPDEVRGMLPALISATGALEFVREAVALGADKSFMDGPVFSAAVAAGDVGLASFMIAEGVDVNSLGAGDACLHPLYHAALLEDHGLRVHMSMLLDRAGADLRTSKGRPVADMVVNAESTVFDYFSSHSDLPLLVALAQGKKLPENARKMIEDRYPVAEKWRRRNMLPHLFDGERDSNGNWFEKMKALDRYEDDALLLKLVIMSDDARTVTPFMMSLGFSPVAEKDRPLTLAVMLGKTEVFNTLATNGADVYAGKSEAFALARKLRNEESLEALQQLALFLQPRFRRKLENQFATGMTLAALRAPRGEDNGDCGLVTAAKAGHIGKLAEAGVLTGMTAADFLGPSLQGATVASILAAQGLYGEIFNQNLWRRDAEGARQVYDALPAHDKVAALPAFRETQQQAVAEANREKLRDKAKSFKLKP
ncbi:MAG: hypothetical protein PW788_02740 [Micavibrio sp.]|nr:hypothetical protein [Micavibrio sp.]